MADGRANADSRSIADAWGTPAALRERAGHRRQLVDLLLCALGADGSDAVHLVGVAAELGEQQYAAGRTVYDLIEDVDALDDAVSSRCTTPAARRLVSVVRRAALAGFGRAAEAAERSRARAVRHDIVNAVGTVRNAILLADEELDGENRNHFLDIATRNSRTAESLVRDFLREPLPSTALWGERAAIEIPRAERADADQPDPASARAAAAKHGLELEADQDGAMRVVIRPSEGQ